VRNEATYLISAIRDDHWLSATGQEFPSRLASDLQQNNLHTITVVMRHWGTYMADASSTAAIAVLSVTK